MYISENINIYNFTILILTLSLDLCHGHVR